MDLRSVLSQPQFVALSDADALAALLADVTKTDNTQYSTTTVGRKLLVRQLMSVGDVASLTTWLPAIPGGGEMLMMMLQSKDGCNFNDAYLRPQMQAVMAALQGANASDLNIARLGAMLLLGQWTVPYWQDNGLPQAPVLADVQAARATIASDALRAKAAGAYNQLVAAMDAGSVVDWAGAKALWAGVS